MESEKLRFFLVYFKGGRCVNLMATKFEVEQQYNQLKGFTFLNEAGETGAVYLDPESVAAIIPVYESQEEQKYDGPTFKVSIKGEEALAITIRAATFLMGPSNSIWFRDGEGKHIPDVYVATSEILACAIRGLAVCL